MPKKKNNTLITVTRKRFSSSSFMAPLMLPIAQHSVFRLFHVNWLPVTYRHFFRVTATKTKTNKPKTKKSRSLVCFTTCLLKQNNNNKKQKMSRPTVCLTTYFTSKQKTATQATSHRALIWFDCTTNQQS